MGKRKKYTYEEVKKIVEDLGYELISDEYINIDSKLIFKDKEGYFYYLSFYDFKNEKHIPLKISKSNPYTIRNIKLWCKLNNKSFKLLSDTYIDSNTKLKWKCLKDNCGEVFEMHWGNISQGKGCSYCTGHKIGKSNCLATKNPELASEWHPTKNGNLTSYDVTFSSNKKVWWKCKNNLKHEWEASVNSRNSQKTGCPYCSGNLPSEDNNLLIINPKICKEWDYIKNIRTPEEYTPLSGKKVWWKCKKCGYEWKASIHNRNRGKGCPQCAESKGEKQITQCLLNKNIKIEAQKTFNNLIGTGGGLLSYDFYLLTYNLLIEYQGEFHDGKANDYVKQNLIIQKEHDRRKKEYALNNGYNFLEIWYWDYDNIEEILDKELLNIQKESA